MQPVLALQARAVAPVSARRSPFTARPLNATQRVARPCRKAIKARAVQDATTAEASSAADGTSTSGDTHPVPMAASLIERAKLAVSTGEVDADFKSTFVGELEAELEALQKRAAEAEAQSSALEETLKATKDQYVRLNADFENFRKRTATEKDALRTSVKGDTVMALVPLIDNFELAKSQLKPATEGELKIDAAYQALYKQMVELFRGLGVEAVPGVGSPFDPNLHDAIMRAPSDEVPDGTVLEEFRKGFQLGDRLLRPSMVKVSHREDGGGESSSSEQQAAADSGSE